MTRRKAWLWGSLAVTLLATAGVAVQSDGPDIVQAVPASGARTPLTVGRSETVAKGTTAASSGVGQDSSPRETASTGIALRSPPDGTAAGARVAWIPLSGAALAAWSAPPVPAPAAPVSPTPEPAPAAGAAGAAPVAPPVPWKWIGRLDDAEGPRALLDGPGGARLVRESDVLDGEWRVDRIAADQLRWTWLPAGLPSLQSLPRMQGRT